MGAVDPQERILHVGGDGESVREAAGLLADDRVTVESTDTARAGRDVLTERDVAGLVCEGSPPDSSSLAFLNAVRESHPDLPVLFVTRDRSIIDDAVAAGATDVYVQRPETDGSQVLARRLANVLASGHPPAWSDVGDSDPAGGTAGSVVGSGRDAAERTEHERRLLELQQTVETVAAHVPIVLFTYDSDGVFTRSQGKALRELGLEPGEAVGESAFELFDGHDRIVGHVRRSLDGEAVQGTVEVGGRTFESWYQPLLDDDGSVEQVVGLSLDITERREREQQLKRRTRAMDEAPIGITLSDPSQDDNPLIYANDQFSNLTGYPEDEILGHNCRFLQGEDTDPEAVAELRQAIAAAEPVSVELRNYRKDGTEFWNQLTIAPVETGDGEVTNYVGFQQDVTERKEHERKLRLRTRAMEEAPIGITIHDATAPGAPITYANEGFEQLTGYPRSAVEGETIALLTGADTDEERVDRVETALARGEHVSEVVLLYRRDGSPFWGRTTLAPVTDEDGVTTHFVGFLQDVTETKEHEQQIQRRLNEFGEVLAEDLRLPVQDATQRLEAAKESGDPAEIEAAERAFRQIDGLIEDLATVHSDAVKARDVFDDQVDVTEN